MPSLMVLSGKNIPSRYVRWGSYTFTATDGKRLTMETNPSGLDILSETVPANKKWTVTVMVEINEEDI